MLSKLMKVCEEQDRLLDIRIYNNRMTVNVSAVHEVFIPEFTISLREIPLNEVVRQLLQDMGEL